MPQNLIQLPKEAYFPVSITTITIQDHKVVNRYGLFGKIGSITRRSNSDMQSLYQFEKHGVSFEAAIEECARELEHDIHILANAISDHYEIWEKDDGCNRWNNLCDFAASETGRVMASQFIEMIRSCDNWEQLYDHMQLNSKFQKEMKGKINRWMEQQCLKI